MLKLTAELMLQDDSLLGEGPLWDHRNQLFYWVDIEGFAIHQYNPATQAHRKFALGEFVGASAVRQSGGLILALKSGFAGFDLATETITPIAEAEAHLPGNRFNDGKVDPAGRFWAGSLHLDEPNGRDQGNLWCLDAAHNVSLKIPNVWISNGLAWTRDLGTMYYIDSAHESVYGFDYDNTTGAISNQRTAIKVDGATQGYPDGMTIDAEDMLWIAHWDGGHVRRWNPQTGEILAEIAVPAERPTSCVFGGPSLDTLYITTARTRLSAERLANQPLAGSIFTCKPGVVGLLMNEYAG